MILWNLPSRMLQSSTFFLLWLSSLRIVKTQAVGDQIWYGMHLGLSVFCSFG